jgi:DNA-binding Xre family transcriptional regulator
MTVRVGYHWHLRRVMAERGMFATSDLVPHLAERGVKLSREQVYRLVAHVPERLSLTTLAALCDILGCAPGDLVEPYRTGRKASPSRVTPSDPPPRPRRARIAPPGGDNDGSGAG